MRCPKCGFHSFDYLDNCKKCGVDLTEQKLRFRFQGYVAPPPAMENFEEEEAVVTLPAAAEAESEAIDFGFDALNDDFAPAAGDGAGTAPGETTFAAAGNEFAEFDAIDPGAIDFAAAPQSSGLDGGASDDFDFAADSGLVLEQPLESEHENLPSDLPKLDERDNEFF